MWQYNFGYQYNLQSNVSSLPENIIEILDDVKKTDK